MSTTKIDCWDEVGAGSNSDDSGRPQFMKLPAGKHQVRLLGQPIKFFKFVIQGEDKQWRSAVPMDRENNPITQNHNEKASERYAINVLDRSDGQLKILEAGISVFKIFREFWNATQRNPGASDNGADFGISVSGAGRMKRYETTFAKNTPLTDEEKKYVLKDCGGLHELIEMSSYKPVPNDEIEQVLFPSAATTPAPEPASQYAPPVQAAPTPDISGADESTNIPF